jgi:hypothetical protein
MATFVFGYGSLIERASRTRTEPAAVDAYPALVPGYKRGWFHLDKDAIGFQPTYLGAVRDQAARCNGVLIPVSDAQLAGFDSRETGYDRDPIDPSKIKLYDGRQGLPKDSKVYIYVSKATAAASAARPIVQSYVDICVNGCLEIEGAYPNAKEAGFVDMFFKETAGWSEHWVNDRPYPRRPFVFQPKAGTIDKLIKQYQPALFDKIKIEG